MKAVLVLELRGLTQQAEVLAQELEHVSMNAQRIRAATIDVTKGAIARVSAEQHPEASGEQGTDTFFWTFPDVDSAAVFGSLLIADLWDKASRQGLYYVKPSLGLGWCEPQMSDSHLLDDGSLETYRVADGGRAFTLYLVGDAVGKTTYPFLGPEEQARKANVGVRPLDWRAVVANSAIDQSTINIPPLLLDSDVVYSDTAAAALSVILGQQGASREILVFGGPPSLNDEMYIHYVRESIRLIRDAQNGCQFAIISYLPVNDSTSSAIWLELCTRLAAECPTRLRFSAFLIGQGQLRPFSYQVFERKSVHVGLRGFSPFRETPTLSSAILIRNARIAQLFVNDFNQSFQSIGAVDDDKHHELKAGLGKLDQHRRTQVETTVRELLEAGA
jgi:hypothetical protein